MCGILGISGFKGSEYQARILAIKLSRRLRHRGPDSSGIHITCCPDGTFNILCHERLQICDLTDNGKQPMIQNFVEGIGFSFVHNGEIYNHKELEDKYADKCQYKLFGHSDSESVGVLYQALGPDFCNELEGMFAIVINDFTKNTFTAYRDHMGIIPLYAGQSKDGVRFFSNELKAIHDQCDTIEIVLPGHFISNDMKQVPWYKPNWHNLDLVPRQPFSLLELNEQLTKSVKAQLMGDCKFGLLISGGVDSSLIAAIAMRLIRDGQIDIKRRDMTEVPSFCIGLRDSPDIKAARQVADYLGTKHYDFVYTIEEGVDAIHEVIYHIETFNTTTIRASIPMYLMARKIKALGVKMVLTGEGADEIFGGYLYFHKAPTDVEFHKECVRKCQDLYKYDLSRANKSMMAWGVEIRPPFMQKEFLEYALNIDPSYKMVSKHEPRIEKYILRKAFDDETNPYIPKQILWRQKEQFSDGVGYGWVDRLKNLAEELCSDELFDKRFERFPQLTPLSKEQYNYRCIFESHFPHPEAVRTVPVVKSIACSTEYALDWDESFKKNTDESGRAVLGVHVKGEELKGVQQ